MASQYNYYQYQTQAQRQQQQTSAAGTGAMEWNGTAWVPAGGAGVTAQQQPAATTSATAPPQQPEAPPGHTLPPPNSTPQQFVAAYSAIYQEWKSQGSQQSQLAATLPVGAQKDEAQNRAQWADYYAELSSRCAHYYNTLMSRGAVQQQPSHHHHHHHHQQQYGQYQAQQQPQSQWAGQTAMAAPAPVATPACGAPAPPPESMKRYVHRCLARCTTAEQKKRIQAKVETVISDHIRNGTLQTTDWDSLECISLEEPQQQYQYQYQQQTQQQQYGSPPPYKKQRSSGSDNHYGHPTSGDSSSKNYGVRSGGAGGGGSSSYYGPSSSSFDHQDQSDFIAFDSGSSPSRGKRGGTKKKKGKQVKQRSSGATSYYAPQDQADDGFERSNATLNARQARFSGQGGLSDAAKPNIINNVERYMGKTVIGGTRKLNEEDFEAMTCKGTCTVLEKEYLRLTAPPRAELVRPEPILKEHLANLKALWLKPEKKRGGGGKLDYVWFCSQFKALRQDLTVQRIFNAFAVHVYETHARIALEQGDLNEFNQCQTQLKELYEKNSHDESEKAGLKNETEFIAYRILYYVFLSGNKKYEGGSSDMMKILLTLSSEQRADPTISHALKVRVAVAEYDYHAFFTLQDDCPNMGAYLMDYLVPSVRRDALQRIQKAFRPHIPVDYVLSELGFDMTDDEDAKEGREWLQSCGCKFSDDGKSFLTKDSVLKDPDLTNKKSSLI